MSQPYIGLDYLNVLRVNHIDDLDVLGVNPACIDYLNVLRVNHVYQKIISKCTASQPCIITLVCYIEPNLKTQLDDLVILGNGESHLSGTPCLNGINVCRSIGRDGWGWAGDREGVSSNAPSSSFFF